MKKKMREIRENSAKKIFLLIFVIILCICPLYATEEIVRTFLHNEEINYDGPTTLPLLSDSKAYEDGTMVVRIIRYYSSSATDNICYQISNNMLLYEMLSLRIIHLNGTVEEKDIILGIQLFNYCHDDLLDYYLIRKNHILVTYNYNTTNPDNTYQTYKAWGMIIDFDGNVYDRIPFNDKDSTISISHIQLNINREKGFIRCLDGGITLICQQYRIELNGTFTKLTNGKFGKFDDHSLYDWTVIPTVDEGYAIVYANTTNISTVYQQMIICFTY